MFKAVFTIKFDRSTGIMGHRH